MPWANVSRMTRTSSSASHLQKMHLSAASLRIQPTWNQARQATHCMELLGLIGLSHRIHQGPGATAGAGGSGSSGVGGWETIGGATGSTTDISLSDSVDDATSFSSGTSFGITSCGPSVSKAARASETGAEEVGIGGSNLCSSESGGGKGASAGDKISVSMPRRSTSMSATRNCSVRLKHRQI